jgi:hypothetical protein
VNFERGTATQLRDPNRQNVSPFAYRPRALSGVGPGKQWERHVKTSWILLALLAVRPKRMQQSSIPIQLGISLTRSKHALCGVEDEAFGRLFQA